MGEYHPHSSCYSTLANMSKPWAFRYPLIDFHGNNGNLDGQPEAADRYCITGDSLVNTNKGLLYIKDIVENTLNSDNDIDIIVKSINTNNHASKLFNSGKHPVYKIELANGLEITGTSNHPLLVLTKDFNLEWKTISELTINDKCVIDLNTYNTTFGEYENIEEAKMLGCMVSEGYITTQNRIGINNKDIDMVIPVKEYFNCNINQRNNFFEVCFTNHTFETLYNFGKTSYERQIPKQILQSTKLNQIAFLRYLFEGDGSVIVDVSPYIEKDTIKVVYSSYSKLLIKQLQIMLATNFGILSTIKTNKKEYQLVLNNYHLNKFQEIGFVSERKNNKLQQAIKEMRNIANNNYLHTPELNTFIHNKTPIKKGVYNIQDLLKYKSYIDEEVFKYCYNIMQYAFIPIKNISNDGEQVVYSIKVDSDCHSFTANALTNHNTESRLHKHAMTLLEGIHDETVEFIPNYSETTTEPTVLPGLFPNLLCNGSYGIAVGYTTNFPPHNLNEVVDAIIYGIEHKDANTSDFLRFIKGPDFPLGACLVNNENIYKLYTEGQASLTFKGQYIIEENEESKNPQIIFIAIPPSASKPKLMEQIYKLCIEEKSIPRVVDVRDESSGSCGIRIVIELHKSAVPNIIINELFKKTNLQQNISFIMRCIDNNTPKLPTLKDLINNYIDFHFECKVNQYNYKLKELRDKLHIQEGYYKILNDIDSAIKIIRNADDDLIAKEQLIKKFKLSDIQANVILDVKLRKLTKLGKNEVEDIINKLTEAINHYELLLNNKDEFKKDFIEQLVELKKNLGDKRRTEIIESSQVSEEEVNEDYIITLTNKNNIKHYNQEDFDNLKGYKDRSEIFIKDFKYNTKNNILFILEDCTYVILPFNLILGDLNKLLNKQKIINIFDYESNINKTLFVITNKGTVKKVVLDKLKNNGKLYPLIEVEENLVNAKLIDNTDKEIVTILTEDGKIGRFLAQSFKETNAGGKGLSLNADNIRDFDVSISKQFIVVISNNSIAKFNDNDFLVKGRIAKPVSAVKANDMLYIKATDSNFKVITDKGLIKEIPLDKVKVSNKNTKPNLIKDTINYIKEEL